MEEFILGGREVSVDFANCTCTEPECECTLPDPNGGYNGCNIKDTYIAEHQSTHAGGQVTKSITPHLNVCGEYAVV